jgi:hypothetical protein
MEKANIPSDEAWAHKAGENTDRNTARDYRNGKTRRLREESREALAKPLGITASELPA